MQRVPDSLSQAALGLPDLRLLVMHGSRARGDAHERSDWDFAYLGAPGFDEMSLRATLARVLNTDNVDVADLARAGGLLRYRVARDGVPVYESVARTFEDFCYEAILFWLDAQHVVREAHADVLEGLG